MTAVLPASLFSGLSGIGVWQCDQSPERFPTGKFGGADSLIIGNPASQRQTGTMQQRG
jgi:hypothetical protein